MKEEQDPDTNKFEVNRDYREINNKGVYVEGNYYSNPDQKDQRPKRDKNQEKLLEKVKEEVNSRLASSLHTRISIILGKEQDHEQVIPPWSFDVKVGFSNQEKINLTPETTIIDIYDHENINGKFLLLGAPGSGKTTTLLQLAKVLITRAEKDANQPIPVLINISSWRKGKDYRQNFTNSLFGVIPDKFKLNKEKKEADCNIQDWLIVKLEDKYGVNSDIAKDLLKTESVILLFDGLDELPHEQQENCVTQLNEFLKPKNWSGKFIISSRLEEYEAYETKLNLNTSISIKPLTFEQIRDYITWAKGIDTEDKINFYMTFFEDKDFVELAKTPLFLCMIVICWKQVSWDKWRQLKSASERRKALFDVYIDTMLKRPCKLKDYKREKVLYWLEFVSNRLLMERKLDFSSRVFLNRNSFMKSAFLLKFNLLAASLIIVMFTFFSYIFINCILLFAFAFNIGGATVRKTIVFIAYFFTLLGLKEAVILGFKESFIEIIQGLLTLLLVYLFYTLFNLMYDSIEKIILFYKGQIPFNSKQFLNYATDRLFLQRVGNEYRFIHRLLQEYFVETYTEHSPQK